MSDYEMLNQRGSVQRAVRRKETARKLGQLLMIVSAVLLAFRGLRWIGFISDMFFVILVFLAVCVASFYAGRIWNEFKR